MAMSVEFLFFSLTSLPKGCQGFAARRRWKHTTNTSGCQEISTAALSAVVYAPSSDENTLLAMASSRPGFG